MSVVTFFCFTLISSIASAANAEQIQARVVAVAHGDTITVVTDQEQRQRIRLAGIDSPEKSQPFADRSRRHLVRMTAGKDATLYCHKIDRYQRKV